MRDVSWRVELNPTSIPSLEYFSLALQIFVKFLRLVIRIFEVWSHEIWIMHTSGRDKLNPTISIEY